MNLEDVVENFEMLDDWEDRYAYLIEIGRSLPPLPDTLKTDENLVPGCMSRAWLVTDTNNGLFHLQADSEAMIVRGLITILVLACNGQPPKTVATYGFENLFEHLGLNAHLSAGRRNGFLSMVSKIRKAAQTSGASAGKS